MLMLRTITFNIGMHHCECTVLTWGRKGWFWTVSLGSHRPVLKEVRSLV